MSVRKYFAIRTQLIEDVFLVGFQIASKQLVGMLIILIAKKSVEHRISDIQSSSIGNGIMGMMVRTIYTHTHTSLIDI